MIYTDFQGERLSLLGFGAMRLPLLENKEIDEAQVNAMVDAALTDGVNYFDTAYPYHGGKSELVLGRALNRHPRDKWLLASKYPGHQIASSYDPAAVFEEQLQKCGVEYFDFYLLHNVCESSLPVYLDPHWGILDYFKEQKRLGRIRHLGFSSHAHLPCLKEFLDAAGDSMEFCQIQLNWMDWTLQDAKSKVAFLNERGIPIWVREPLRGGKLCALAPEDEVRLAALRPDEGVPAWGFRFVQEVPGVTMILSGMSSIAQMRDNLRTFSARKPLSGDETQALLDVAERMKDCVPCTGCRYCVDHCPQGLDIPMMLSVYNEIRFSPSFTTTMQLEAMPENKLPSACLACGACAAICPQKIDVPRHLADLAERFKTLPKWADICREREEAAKKLKK